VTPEAITTKLQNVFTKPADNTDAAATAAAVITSVGSKGRKSDEVQAAALGIVEVFSKGSGSGDAIAEAFASSAAATRWRPQLCSPGLPSTRGAVDMSGISEGSA
jgi:hypothetical protein